MDAIIYKDTIYGGGGAMRGNYFNPIIYSAEEREVGVWKNNKPLYQKTIVIDNVPSGSGTFDIYTLDSDIENVVNHISFMNSGVYTRFVPYVDVGNYDMNIYFNLPTIKLVVDNDSWAGYTLYITIQYTKTTDVAGSGKYNTLGIPNVHYTTDEQVIGTWIDGKPLYEKTFTGLSQATNGADWVTVQGVNIPSIKDLINTTAWASGGGGEQIKMALAECSAVSDGVRVTVISSAWNRTINKMTVQYTKTTD